jgi:hypothetical protein
MQLQTPANLYILKKRLGINRVYPGRPSSGSIGFRRANSQVGFYLDPDRSQARVDPPGQSGFQNYIYILKKRLGISRVYSGRPGSGSIGFRRANFQVGFYLDPDRSQAWVDLPGWSRFQNYT